MASADKSSHVPVVLRVKRRRDVDPADALVVSKVRKLDPSTAHEKEASEEASVFMLAGTVGDVNEETLLGKIRHHRDHRVLIKHNPLAKLSVSAIHDRQREEVKSASLDNRFQHISKLRHLDELNPAVVEDSSPGCDDKVQIYDVVVGANLTSDQQAEETADTLKKSIVTCNSEAMIREKVAPHPSSGGSVEYVYDLYYSDNASAQDISTYDWSSLTVFEPEYVHDVIDSEEEEEEDDDSNAEDNWRNDYPDEDEWKGEEEGEGSQSSGSDNDVSNQAYRRREIPVMLDYDELGYDEDEYGGIVNPVSSGCYFGNGNDEEKGIDETD